jgi:hypothetical protein
MRREALIVLAGITANRNKRRQMLHYFTRNSDYAVFVPSLPYRTGMRACAAWLRGYLDDTVRPAGYSAVHAIAYIAGGLLLRCLERESAPVFERLVQFRSPIQEQVAAVMIRRLGRVLTGWLGGRAVLDLADGWPQSLPSLPCARQQGLVIELGRSRMARLLGIRQNDAENWRPERLLPGAADVLRIPESHDDVYTSVPVLAAILQFIRTGCFSAPERGN